MSAEIVLRLTQRTDRNGDDYYFGFFDLKADLDLEDIVVMVFPGKAHENGALMKIRPKEQRRARSNDEEPRRTRPSNDEEDR